MGNDLFIRVGAIRAINGGMIASAAVHDFVSRL
jgi:hypothetical protein